MAAAPASAQSAVDYLIGAQDVLTIQVFDQADLGGKYTVETDGTFSFPLIGRVRAGGMSLRALEGELKTKLADGYFRNPQVTVAIEQYRSQRVFVMGEVRAPGPVPLTGGMTLIEALSRAGSTQPTASGEVAVVRAPQGAKGPVMPSQEAGGTEVFRASIRDLESGSLSQNIELHDGDTIFVPRAETAYVFGQVKNPGGYALQKDTTILQALSLAGGVTENGAMNRVAHRPHRRWREEGTQGQPDRRREARRHHHRAGEVFLVMSEQFTLDQNGQPRLRLAAQNGRAAAPAAPQAPMSVAPPPAAAPQEVAIAEPHLTDYLKVLHKRRWTAATAFLLVLAGVTVYTFTATPIFEGAHPAADRGREPQRRELQGSHRRGPGEGRLLPDAVHHPAVADPGAEDHRFARAVAASAAQPGRRSAPAGSARDGRSAAPSAT